MRPRSSPDRYEKRRSKIFAGLRTPGDKMLMCVAIRFRYRRDLPWVLDDVSLHITPGEVVGLIGGSGTGKTTLAKILSGYYQPVSGWISLDQKPLPRKSVCPVQLVMQHPERVFNPYFKLKKSLLESRTDFNLWEKALALRTAWLERRPHELSLGELQRIALARSLGRHTRYLIADEATGMLDALNQVRIWKCILKQVEKRKIGVLAISHDHRLLARISHRIVSMDALLSKSRIISC